MTNRRAPSRATDCISSGVAAEDGSISMIKPEPMMKSKKFSAPVEQEEQEVEQEQGADDAAEEDAEADGGGEEDASAGDEVEEEEV